MLAIQSLIENISIKTDFYAMATIKTETLENIAIKTEPVNKMKIMSDEKMARELGVDYILPIA